MTKSLLSPWLLLKTCVSLCFVPRGQEGDGQVEAHLVHPYAAGINILIPATIGYDRVWSGLGACGRAENDPLEKSCCRARWRLGRQLFRRKTLAAKRPGPWTSSSKSQHLPSNHRFAVCLRDIAQRIELESTEVNFKMTKRLVPRCDCLVGSKWTRVSR